MTTQSDSTDNLNLGEITAAIALKTYCGAIREAMEAEQIEFTVEDFGESTEGEESNA